MSGASWAALAVTLSCSLGVAGDLPISADEDSSSEMQVVVRVSWDVLAQDRVTASGASAPLVVLASRSPIVYSFTNVSSPDTQVFEEPPLDGPLPVEFSGMREGRAWFVAFFDKDLSGILEEGEAYGVLPADIRSPQAPLDLGVHSCSMYYHSCGLHPEPQVLASPVTAEVQFNLPVAAATLVTWTDAETGAILGTAESSPEVVHRVAMTGLRPHRRHAYEVRWDADATGAPHEFALWTSGTFVTPPTDPWAPVRFAVIGDTGAMSPPNVPPYPTLGYTVHARLIAQMAAFRPEFLINTGDIIGGNNPYATDDLMQYRGSFECMSPILRSACVFPVRGNHDASCESLLTAFMVPESRPYYAQRWGSVTLFVVDDSLYTVDPAQLAWLDAQLTQTDSESGFVVVAVHDPPMAGAAWQFRYNSLVHVLKAHHVDAIFGGHFHGYERNQFHEFTQIVSGGGGSDLQPEFHWEVPNLEPLFHFCTVDVAGGVMTISVWEDGGGLHDQLTILGRASPPCGIVLK